MTHHEIDQLVKSWIVDSATRPANARVQQIVLRLTSDLCKAIEDLDIGPNEFWKGLEYLSAAGAANPLGFRARRNRARSGLNEGRRIAHHPMT